MKDTALAYLNTASCGLLNPQALESTNVLYNEMLTCSSKAAEDLRNNGLQRIRQTVADFLKAPVENIAFVPNFSYALNAIVQSLKGTEKVMLYRNDYPSVLEPFRINRFNISWIEAGDGFDIDIDALKSKLLSEKIQILAISHVQWMSGFRLDLNNIGNFCADNNIVLIVDATQSLGAVPIFIDELKIDVLIASNYKWMNAGFGSGVMYMSDAFLARYEPVIGGNTGYVMADEEWKHMPSVKSYEPGHLNLHGLLILEAAINQKLEIGIDSIEMHNMKLATQLVENIAIAGMPLLGNTDMANRSAIVLVQAEEALQQYLLNEGIVVIWRNGYIRISPHYYNTEVDIDRMINSFRGYYLK